MRTIPADNALCPAGNLARPDWVLKVALARYGVVKQWREYRLKQKGRIKESEATQAFLLAYKIGAVSKEFSESLGDITRASLYRWKKVLEENGGDYQSLCPRWGKWDKGGQQGLGQLTPEAETAFLTAWLNPNRPSVVLAYRVMCFALEKLGQDAPNVKTVYRFADRFKEDHHDLVVLMREGEKALNDKVSDYIRRDRRALEVGQTLVADGHVLNFECLHPETGRPFRPTLIGWFDWKSGLICGWEFLLSENTIGISSALRMAIRHLGKIPKSVVLDNGKAFKGKFFTQSGQGFEILQGLYARLGIATQFATPYRAQVKPIERFFGTFDNQFSKLVPSYVGRNIEEKPAWRRRDEKFHKSRHEKRNPGLPTLREAGAAFAAYVKWFAENMTHPDFQGQTCGEVFLAERGPGVDLAELDFQFLWTTEVHPKRSGFRLAGLRYVSDRLYGLNKSVVVKYSWASLEEVYLFDRQGRSLGAARPEALVHPQAALFGTEEDLALVADGNRRRAAQKKATLNKARVLAQASEDSPGPVALPYHLTGPALKQLAAPAEEKQLEQATADGASENIRPARFDSEFVKYNWIFLAWNNDGYSLEAGDMEFMRKYEASEEYRKISGRRFAQLAEIGLKSPTSVEVGVTQCD